MGISAYIWAEAVTKDHIAQIVLLTHNLDLELKSTLDLSTKRDREKIAKFILEEIVLVVADRSLTSIQGTCELTARDRNDVYTGDNSVDVAPARDLTEVASTVLGPEDDEADEEDA